jgi:predicted enzyme related to lactoylglutathione lyase
VTATGGSLLVAPMEAGELGRLAIAADPAGAAFGIWQAGRHIGAEVTNQPGGLTWEDLRSTDPDGARAFYSSLFGYRTQPLADAGPDYTTFCLDDERPLGGIGGMMGSAEGLPSHWIAYFGVADTAKAVSAAQVAGGTVVLTDFDSPYGRMAGLSDPFGAMFWVIDNTEAAE